MRDAVLSVIVPIYNVEEYVERCIKSIVSSTYQSIEIILVDDGSTDSSGIICDKCAQEDGRIIVIHRENGGLVSARKAGLERASGKYTTFVDGDDYIGPYIYEDLIGRIKESGAEMLVYGFSDVPDQYDNHSYPEENIVIHRGKLKPGKYDLANYDEYIDNNFEVLFSNGVVEKIFVTDILKETIGNVRNGLTKGEDLAITLSYFPECKFLCIATDIAEYYYVQRSTSITHEYDYRSIERVSEFVKSMYDYTCKVSVPEIWKKVIYNETYSIIMSDCVGCCLKHYGKFRLLGILNYFRKMSQDKIIRDFYRKGIDNKYFANENRTAYSRYVSEGQYLKAFLRRVQKKY